jgi:dipeptidyl-peptidase-4
MRGRDFLKIVYRSLGRWEVNDQIEAAKWLGTLPYVDAKRIGIWGASYGGFMACLCLLRGADVFKMGIAMAPVTHWSLYDSIYTERYMRRPTDNPQGYEFSSLIREAGLLEGALLIIHGTADDNVHFQNTARLVTALQEHGKTFETMFYPGEDHSLSGAGQHLDLLLTRFVAENL